MCCNLDLNNSSSHCLAKTSGQDVYSQTKVNGPSCCTSFLSTTYDAQTILLNSTSEKVN